MGENFCFKVDDELTVSYESAGDSEELIIEPESFSVIFSFNCQNLISDERKYKAIEKKLDSHIQGCRGMGIIGISIQKNKSEQIFYTTLLKKYFLHM